MCCFVIFTWTFSETVIYQNKYFFCLYIKQKIIAYESLICTSAWTNNKNVQYYLEHLSPPKTDQFTAIMDSYCIDRDKVKYFDWVNDASQDLVRFVVTYAGDFYLRVPPSCRAWRFLASEHTHSLGAPIVSSLCASASTSLLNNNLWKWALNREQFD